MAALAIAQQLKAKEQEIAAKEAQLRAAEEKLRADAIAAAKLLQAQQV